MLNSRKDDRLKNSVLQAISRPDTYFFESFSLSDVGEAIKAIKHGKSAGMDGIYGEHFIHAHKKVNVLLCLVFNAMVIHGYLPSQLLNTIIVPLVKDKRGNLTDGDNYRPLAITCIASKILELLVLNRYNSMLKTSDNQFGFKKEHSTDMCVFAMKQVIDYYTNLSSPVYICFLDASKAFDKVNHWSLFDKLFKRKIPPIIVRMLLV